MIWKEIHTLQFEKASVGTIVYPPRGRCGPRIQKGLQLVLLQTGSMNIWIEDESFHVTAGHVVLLMPDKREDIHFDPDSDSWHRWIQLFGGDWTPAFIDHLHTLPQVLPISDNMNRMMDLILSLPDHQVRILNMLCRSAFLLFMEEAVSSRKSETTHPLVQMVKSQIKDKYDQNITLEMLADLTLMSKEYLIRTFVKDTGITPIRYLWNYRIERSLELLRNTGLTVEEIAYRTGFKSVYHFSKKFKQKLGKSPIQYRHETWHDKV